MGRKYRSTVNMLWQILSLEFVAPWYGYIPLLVLALLPAVASFQLFFCLIFSRDVRQRDTALNRTMDGIFRKETVWYLLFFTTLLVFIGPCWAIITVAVTNILSIIGFGIIIGSAIKDFADNQGPSGSCS